jgi:hypothetical protein
MISAILGILAMIVVFLVCGSLGGVLGEKLERKWGGEELGPSCGMIFGSFGLGLAIWVLNVVAGN